MFNPVNRYIWINVPQTETAESLIVLPSDYKPAKERYIEVEAVKAPSDARFEIEAGAKLVVDRSMIEEITLGGTIYNVILDNYVVGILE